jgi:hypothetical protein
MSEERYATMVPDMDAVGLHLLLDRTAGTIAARLQAHRGVACCLRDGPVATRCLRFDSPNALQVADRSLLWHNLSHAVKKTLAAHRGGAAAR